MRPTPFPVPGDGIRIYLKPGLRLTLLLLMLLAAAAPVAARAEEPRNPRWARPVALPQTENFFQVTPGLFRAAQPTAAAFREYEHFGIKTVINLRAQHSDRDLVRGSSLKLIEVPIDTWDIGDREVITALRHIKNEPGPVLVHCQHGADRTGTIMAMYRIIFEGWTREEAIDELRNGGYGYHSLWTNIPKYIRNVDLNRIRAGVDYEERLAPGEGDGR